MRILLTGSSGQLGSDIVRACEGAHELFAHDIDLDITDRAAVAARVEELRPELVINAAAYTDVDGAETDREAAYRVNALGPWNLALACQAAGAALMQVSTDFVFSGEAREPYTEFDRPDPRGVYGRSKYAGEQIVMSLLDRFYICRTSWLYGASGSNFVKTIMRAGLAREEVRVVNDQEGSPTFSKDLAAKLLEIAATRAYGIYHVSNSGSCTWYEFARLIFSLAGIPTPVVPVTTEELGRPAPRPAYSVLRGLALELAGLEPMRPFAEALEEFVVFDLPGGTGKARL